MRLYPFSLLICALACSVVMAHHHEQHNKHQTPAEPVATASGHSTQAAKQTEQAQSTQMHSEQPAIEHPPIEQTMHQQWPGQLTLAAVTTQQDLALVSWHYLAGDTAPRHGRALWRWQQGQWQLVSCAGRGLLDRQLVEQAGVPPAAATALIAAHEKAEARLPRDEVHQFDSFMAAQNSSHH